MPRFQDIPQFTRHSTYKVDIGLDYLPIQYLHFVQNYGLDVSPDFQRGNVWTVEQKIRFMEYFLRGGISGRDLYINCTSWNRRHVDSNEWTVLVDGKQRLDAALGFLSNEFPVFGHYYREFTGRLRMTGTTFHWHVNDLQTREECLQWYLDLNTGGTVHSDEEIEKVKQLLAKRETYVPPTKEQLLAEATTSHEIVQATMHKLAEEQAERKASFDAAQAEASKSKRKGKRR